MVNYSEAKIYKIVCKDINVKEIYIGSTCNELKKRKNQHKTRCNNSNDKKYNLNVYQYIRKNGGWQNFDMIIIEKFECNDKLELHARERYWLENLGATLNSYIPTRSNKEYRENNKQEIHEKKKEYYEKNKKKINEKNKERYEKNKQEINKERNEKAKLDRIKCKLCDKEMRRDCLNKHNKNIHNIH